jgi:PRTRC genetic system ThiF family protein
MSTLHNLDKAITRIDLIGAGGSGSQMLTGLARINLALRALRLPEFRVTVFDPDKVTEANVGRQLFSPADIGQYKANVLVHRLNAFFGTQWDAECRLWEKNRYREAELVIGCVDTGHARRLIGKALNLDQQYWLDLGNDTQWGQVILGGNGLPSVLDRHPGLGKRKETNTPSCSLAAALEKQDLFVNQAVTTWALHLLWTLLRHRQLAHCGYYINLQTGRVSPVNCP